jgi:hypothetical protein
MLEWTSSSRRRTLVLTLRFRIMNDGGSLNLIKEISTLVLPVNRVGEIRSPQPTPQVKSLYIRS